MENVKGTSETSEVTGIFALSLFSGDKVFSLVPSYIHWRKEQAKVTLFRKKVMPQRLAWHFNSVWLSLVPEVLKTFSSSVRCEVLRHFQKPVRNGTKWPADMLRIRGLKKS